MISPSLLPDIRTEDASKTRRATSSSRRGARSSGSTSQPRTKDRRTLLYHDGLLGSGIYAVRRQRRASRRYDNDPRSFPFALRDTPPDNELIIGSAGGNEILASLPSTRPISTRSSSTRSPSRCVTDHFADYTGHLAEHPHVNYVNGDGRSYLARSNKKYDLVWFVAPDSYAATNAASSGAFVLSESYLYTSEMIKTDLDHLTADGIMVVQFGELNFDEKPESHERATSSTARKALERARHRRTRHKHMLVGRRRSAEARLDLSTILVKRTPFTPAEVDAVRDPAAKLPRPTRRTVRARPTASGQLGDRDRHAAGGGAEPLDRRRVPLRRQARSPTTGRSSGTSPGSAR